MKAGFVVLVLLALCFPVAGAFHAPDPDPVEAEVLYVRQTGDGLSVAVARKFALPEGETVVRVWVPAGAQNGSVTLQTSNYLEGTRALAAVAASVETLPEGAFHAVDLARFDMESPDGRYRMTLAYALDSSSFVHVGAVEVPAFRALLIPSGDAEPTVQGVEGRLVPLRVTDVGVTFATPAEPHAPLRAGQRVEVAFAEPGSTQGTGFFFAGLAVGAVGSLLLVSAVRRGLTRARAA